MLFYPSEERRRYEYITDITIYRAQLSTGEATTDRGNDPAPFLAAQMSLICNIPASM